MPQPAALAFMGREGVIYCYEYLEAILITTFILVGWFHSPEDTAPRNWTRTALIYPQNNAGRGEALQSHNGVSLARGL